MNEARPSAEAVAVRAERILAVGTNEEMAAFTSGATTVISLGGLTVLPGFIDGHQHRIGDGPAQLGVPAGRLLDDAIASGLTTIDELYVDQGRLDELRYLDTAGVLRLRVNAYLPVQQNTAEAELLGDYYNDYRPNQLVSPHVRVAGLKVFTDYDNARALLWQPDELEAFVAARHQEGWPLAVKTVATRSLEMALDAFAALPAETGDSNVPLGRLEHMLFATPDQIGRISDLGLVPMINLNVPGELVGTPDIDDLLSRDRLDTYAPWRSLFDVGIPAGGISGFPSLYVDEPAGAPFGSPIHLIYQAVTRVGNLGVRSPDELLDQALTVEQALSSLTVNAARADREDDVKGSISPGKLADMVVLSANPLAVRADQINDITVLLTMIGGQIEWCAPGKPDICVGLSAPSEPPPLGIAATASSSLPGNPPTDAVDGNRDTIWNSGAAPEQWIQLDLGTAGPLAGVRLVVAQDPGGETVHELWLGSDASHLRLVHQFSGVTRDGDELRYTPARPEPDVRYVRIVTADSPSWVAWREVEIEGRP